MTDYTDSLIKNFTIHTSAKFPSVNLADKLEQLGESLRYARNSFTSLTSAFINKQQQSTHSITTPAPDQVKGKLDLVIVEARNLTLTNPLKADIYCVVQYDGNTMSTLDQSTTTTTTIAEAEPLDIFEKQLRASAPKWQYSQSFDVLTDQDKIIVQVFDRGNRLVTGEDLCLGMTEWKYTFGRNTLDLWLRLKDQNDISSGEIRLQATYSGHVMTKLTPNCFRILRQIGHGSFGKVYKVEKRDTKRIYAMKVLSKQLLIKRNEVDHTLAERNVLVQTITSPFIVTLKFSFQTASHLFLVMDYLPGGDLFTCLERHRILEEHQARFYIAELVCALEEIHAHKVVYRDLKPENILLDAQGHIALTDFGLCKELKDNTTTSTFCGTSEYLAPEMVLKKEYTQAIDWWSLGILLYELLTGNAPFHSVHLDVLYRRILNQPLSFPSSRHLSMEAKDLIQQLLKRDPTKRLGSTHGATDIKKHPFFKNIRWDQVARKQMSPPSLSSQRDKSTSMAINIPSSLSMDHTKKNINKHDSIPLNQSTQNVFQGFSYIRDDGPLHPSDVDNDDDDDDDDDLY
ncbi:protein kinase A catalytic subunit [Halteromyces radiatus]|uniref:protein kinase A catalytic subunit n=1 Tax=Halteromyces radiatus TaxID=101107 RepID=UPI00221F3E75|nr:protein kinase A catalytic subunit [Halteromyces radiatus]KAI8097483.1 protein kinase A catalytic subunit [Halteromyces radiatus]